MAFISRGFHGRRPPAGTKLPPGQYETTGFPVLSAGPTPHIRHDDWKLSVTTEAGKQHVWDWAGLMALPAESPTVDLHCVTKWSKLGTEWRGVSLDVLLADVETAAEHVFVTSYGGYTTNIPLADLVDGKAWIVYGYGDSDLAPEHGGPARLLVPHLYLWKSAKWVHKIELQESDVPGFWETAGYHNYGDPWKEQRYQGD
ncbi:Sulfoxide reductase catalytic subunit YedY [Streptomyces sp. MBT84]|uniref:Sulfite oxidase-like oxidoreductase n=1 Tax=Streptomyces lannensis TaxID=766498 RepID=A0ABP7LCS2_9ACTN|nr:molybdopterin-dependent oxidoreductase [Streptomyces sp. MBT84]MBW8707157.1 Sulfoxide reductase catalytic subunit YedY [Streptomyces sp. MBT84]